MLLAAVTYAQVIWAQIALAMLIILGPIFIPFLVFDPLSFLFWGWFRAMIIYSLYAVMAGAVLRVFSAVGIAYVTTLGNANLNIESLTEVGLWMLAVVPLFIAGLLASLKCGELASMLVTSGSAAGSGLMGMAATGGTIAASRAGAVAKASTGEDEMSKSKARAKDAGAEYAEIWGETIHTNRHLRVLSIGLGVALLLVIIIVIRIVSVEPPRPIVVRVDEVGRAEAVAYEAMEAQADPLDPTTKYFLNRFIYDFYSRRRATVQEHWSRSLALPVDGTRQCLVPRRESERRPSCGGRGDRRACRWTGSF